MKNLYNSFLSILVIAIMLLITSCNKIEQEPIVEGPVTLKVINASSESQSVDFYQNTTKMNATAIIYGSESTTITGVSGLNRYTFTSAGSSVGIAAIDVTTLANTSYNVFLSKSTSGSPQIYGFENDRVSPAAGKVKVRFINLGSTLINKVNVSTTNGIALQNDIEFRVANTYLTIDAGTNMNALVVGSLDATFINGSSLITGNNYTIWFDTETPTKVKYFIIKDN